MKYSTIQYPKKKNTRLENPIKSGDVCGMFVLVKRKKNKLKKNTRSVQSLLYTPNHKSQYYCSYSS